MISVSSTIRDNQEPGLGLAAIETYAPEWVLPNAWYDSLMAKKFVKHTGIQARCISLDDEVTMAGKAILKLRDTIGLDLTQCAGLLLASPSLIPLSVANKYLPKSSVRQEQPNRLAWGLCQELSIRPRQVLGINGFCSGYAKAMQLIQATMAPRLQLRPSEFILLVTASRISRITDFGCRQSGALFGDFATVTVISRSDSQQLPIHLELLDSQYERQPAPRAFFDFELRNDVLVPDPAHLKRRDKSRIVFSLDGMGIADTAPRAMAAAAASMAARNNLAPESIDHIVPHQAGLGIVRLTGMKLEEAGFTAEPVNGLTERFGNVSSGSVPLALKQNWDQLQGNILCPVAAVGAPGRAEVSQGCILLRAAARRRSMAA
ncbi:MAG: hypothetical protein NXI32_00025 [bacterium]|nr:hypothetical protein [bacterium]